MRTESHALSVDRIALPRRLVPRRPTPYEIDPRMAYLQWLSMEARLLRIELGLEEGEFTPCNTFTHSFHFRPGHDWRDLPQPSTRAEMVLAAVGVKVPRGVLVPEGGQ